MSKKDRSKGSAPGPLSPEDAALWEKVTGTADPLLKGKSSVVERTESVAEPAQSAPSAKKKTVGIEHRQAAEPPKPPAPPPVSNFDRKEARRLGSGRTSVDARIDLHGMRQHEAHVSLKAFLARAQAKGHRHVLVITGKGGKRENDGSYERGVLNREAPRWLSEPEFRKWVVSFAPASKRHGGEGALYVRLRRNRLSQG